MHLGAISILHQWVKLDAISIFRQRVKLNAISIFRQRMLRTNIDIASNLTNWRKSEILLALRVAFKVNYYSEICGLCWYFCNLKFVGRRLRNHPDFVTQMGFWPFWPWKWPWRSIMTLNFLNSWEHPDFELCENIQILDVLTKLGFWPFWPWKWPWRSIMTLNLKSVAFVPYVEPFSEVKGLFWPLFSKLGERRRRKDKY